MEAELKVSEKFFPPGSHQIPSFQIQYILAHLSDAIRKDHKHHNDPEDLLSSLSSKYEITPNPRLSPPTQVPQFHGRLLFSYLAEVYLSG